ncbi:vitellogenin-like [Pristis pectinata]|uniref:vitellogenin-like n=1 Tax=Pristis pectinata TaxID=685728 RepID=UPI00223CCA17|nr:vitellogenin-like [Pristis pectinata]
MRTIIFVLIVSLVGSQKLKYEPSFSEGLMQVYKYEGVILSGLPESGLSRAGVKINCGLSIIPQGRATYLLKVTDFQILEYNGIWPSDPFTSAHKLTQRLAAELTKPVKFEYSNGQVGNIFAPANLPEDILNIHRGILNIFQITIKKSQNFYELQEAGIEGVCLTNYIIQENKKANRITITKSKDLNKCQEKVMLFTGAAYASCCPAFQERGRNVRASATFTQILKPTASGAILQEARVREVHLFTPFHELDGTAITEARQNLVLVDIKMAVISLPRVQFVERGTLKYRYSEGVLQKPLQLTHPQNLEKAILETLKNLEAHSVPKVHSDTPAKFLQLVQLLRSASETTVSTLWDSNHSGQIRRWILFALPAVGTVDALRFIKTKIQRFEVTMRDAAQTLALALHQVTADLHTLSLVKELLVTIQVQQSPVLRPLVFLGYGSMVYRYCADQLTCPNNVLALLHSLLVDSAARGNEEDMALALKAIGNAGQPESIKPIMKLLPSTRTSAANVPLKIQVDAIMALRNILKKDPIKVQVVTLQIFMNKRNHPELRMSACAVYLCTRPPLNAVLVLANSLLKETCLQVASFAYSLLRSLARSSLPSISSLAAASRMAVNLLGARYDQLGFQFSHAFHPDVFSYKLMTGVSAKVLLVNDAGSLIPSVAAAKVSGHMLGGFTDLIEVGLRMEGLQEAIMKSREKVRGIPDLKQIQRILNKFPDLKSVPAKMPLASAYFKLFNQEITFVEFRRDYIHKAIQTLTGVDVKQNTLRRVMDQLRKPVELRPSAALVTSELRRFIPTCLGLSTELSLISAAVAKAALSVEANIPATTSTLSQLLGTNIELKAQINPSVAVYSKAMMGINAPFIQSGLELTAKFQSALPIDVSVKINAKEGNLRINSVPVQQENQIMTLKSEVFAVSRSIENLVTEKVTPILPEIKEANIVNQKFKSSQESQSDTDVYPGIGSDGLECSDKAQRPAPKPWVYHSCISMSNFGFEVCLDAKAANILYIRHSPLYRLMGTHVARVLVRPVHSEAEVKKLMLEVQTGPKTGAKIIRLLEKEELPLERTYGGTVLMKGSHAQTGLRADEAGDGILLSKPFGATVSHKKGEAMCYPEPASRYFTHAPCSDSPSDKHGATTLRESARFTSRLQNQTGLGSSSSSGRSLRGRDSSQSDSSPSGQSLHWHHPTNEEDSRWGWIPGKRSDSSRQRSHWSRSNSDRSHRPRRTNKEILEIEFNSAQNSQVGSQTQSSGTRPTSKSWQQRSSSQSSEELDLLGELGPPVLVLIAKAVRSGGKLQGYQLTGSVESTTGRPRVHLRGVELDQDSRWRMCVDAGSPRPHKAMMMYRWGENCQKYKLSHHVSLGYLASHPALKIQTKWALIPEGYITGGRMIASGLAYLLGFSNKFKGNPSHQITQLIALTTPWTIDTIVKLPRFTIYYQGFELPFPLHVPAIAPIVRAQGFESTARIPHLLLTMDQSKCVATNDRVVTFDGNELNYHIPNDCFYVLTKDCTSTPNFVLLLRRARSQQTKKRIKLLVSAPNTVIEAHPTHSGIKLLVDSVEKQPSVCLLDVITIQKNRSGITLQVPSISIERLYFDGDKVQIVLDQMMGKTCGLCGLNNGEKKLAMPSREEARDEEQLFESWLCSGTSCKDDCRVRQEFVELGKVVNFEGQASRCYSVETVQRCLARCTPMETRSRTVNFHCVPSNRFVDASTISSFRWRSTHISHPMDSHTDCSCQCTKA